MEKKIGLYWFSNDLRLHDNALLLSACAEVDELICLYCHPLVTPYLRHFAQETSLGSKKQQFLDASLSDLNRSLGKFNQRLWSVELHPYQAIKYAVNRFGVTNIYAEVFAGTDEQVVLKNIQHDCPYVTINQQAIRTLFSENQLPFELHRLPETFTQFRKQVEGLSVSQPQANVSGLPPMPNGVNFPTTTTLYFDTKPTFLGGEQSGLEHCRGYFASFLASQYKQTRNGLDGMEYSTKFSPWLASGSVSPKTIYAMLKRYEQVNGANDSTYWIYFELLWREYFYWYARKYQQKLFRFAGIHNRPPLTSFYAQRFKQWKKGETPFPIVNACMHQLNITGYMSNRGRQLVASCLVHELGLDWRYGAAYFETQLIDYDVGSNWGNWQYLAGVGADPRGSRQFNLEKQTQQYDPDFSFIDKWQGWCTRARLDSVDMVDWPIMSEKESGDN
ncbi:deoxyribodipyrimidine photo-lyase [Vibrio sp. ES.051]|uniref:DASH family cryptochrome n=1 Tax=Vibrio sp. ES.051 TaxID=1761909 RepID=UPI000BF9F883|nr:DASH family cryptochrome [Vibrio sp. ES.051]PFG58543.1 deoxyribodipyrimidine photo-lyase [Vibrio sp. ES.051]